MKRQITALAACALLALGFTTVSAATTAAALPPASVSATADTAGIDAYSDTTDTATAIIPQSTTYSVSMDSDSMEEMVDRMTGFTGEALIAIVAILVIFFLAPVGALALLFWFIYKNRKQKARLAELAMEKGQPLPEGLAPGRLEPVELVWRKGIRNVSIGLGLACLFAFMEWGWAIGIALFVAIYGGGQMVIARTSAAKGRKGGEADEEAGTQRD